MVKYGDFEIDPEVADLWMAIADVPENVRDAYYARMHEIDGEINAVGLLRFWRSRRDG